MTKHEFLVRFKNENINLAEYIVVVDSLTDEPFVLGCYKENNTWKIYETKERSGHFIIDEVQNENIVFDELYELVKLQEKYIKNRDK
ncbi:hypothetical protein GLW20_11940 [Virgibacillus halodenitrificans]|nr:hypothetical protein [Virgibacillus halodenitrificans]